MTLLQQLDYRKKQKSILEQQGKTKSWAYEFVCNNILCLIKQILLVK